MEHTLGSVRWTLRRELSRLTWRGLVGAALIVLALGFAAATLLPAQQRAAQLRQDVSDLRARLRSVGEGGTGGGVPVAPPRATQLENFYAFFPHVDTLPDWVGRIHTAAARNGLTLESGDYLLERRKDQRLVQYQVTLPVRGSYGQIRGFVAEVLEKVPAAALDDIVLKRESIGAPALEARIRWVIYLSGEEAR
jgi:Tfp pilus assembly protein PilO